MDGGSVYQLRNQVAKATNEAEAAKLDVEAFRRILESHVLRLQRVLATVPVSSQALQEALRALSDGIDQDFAGSGTDTRGTYELLRKSLDETYKRRDNIKQDMARAESANEDLSLTIQTLKGTNKRLVSEVHRQTEEIKNLTKQRLRDVEIISDLETHVSREHGVWEKEVFRAQQQERENWRTYFDEVHSWRLNQVGRCKEKMSHVGEALSRLEHDYLNLKQDAGNYEDQAASSYRNFETSIVERVAKWTQNRQKEVEKLDAAELTAHVRLRTAQDLHENKVLEWDGKRYQFVRDSNEAAARHDAHVKNCEEHIQNLDAARREEGKAHREECDDIFLKIDLLGRRIASLDGELQVARVMEVRQQSRLSEARAGKEQLSLLIEGLVQEVEKGDAMVSEAVRKNGKMLQLVEDQRQDLQRVSDEALRSCRSAMESDLDALEVAYAARQDDTAHRLEFLKELLSTKAAKIQSTTDALGERRRVCDSIKHDVALWRSQHDLVTKASVQVERELQKFQKDVVDKELVQLRCERQKFAEKLVLLNELDSGLKQESAELKGICYANEISSLEREGVLQDVRRQTEVELKCARDSLSEADVELASARAEAHAASRSIGERRDRLENRLEGAAAETCARQRELEDRLREQRLRRADVEQTFRQLQNENDVSLKEACAAPALQIADVENRIAEMQQSTKLQLNNFRAEATRLDERAAALDEELAAARIELRQVEHDIEESTSRATEAMSRFEHAQSALECEKKVQQGALEKTRFSIENLMEKIGNASRDQTDAKRRLIRETADARTTRARRRGAAEHRLQVGRISPSASMVSMMLPDVDVSAVSAVSAERERIEALARENQQLRRYMAEHRLNANHIQHLGSQMQKSLHSMEGRASILRSRSAGALDNRHLES